MNSYDHVEAALSELHKIIDFVHGIKPREYAVQGVRVASDDWIIYLEYAPGEQVDLYSSAILKRRKGVIGRILQLDFKPVWREIENGQERIYA